MKLVNSLQMAKIDRETQEQFAFPALLLMENAGIKIYSFIKKNIWKQKELPHTCVILAGKGNNGGDALVIARQCIDDLRNGIHIILAVGRPDEKSLCGINLKICKSLGIQIIDYQKEKGLAHKLISSCDCLIDGILGTGISAEVRPPLANLIEHANNSPALRISIDVPSGIGDAFKSGFTAFRAEHTCTVELPKSALYLPFARPYCGDIHIIKIGFPTTLTTKEAFTGELLKYDDFFRLLPQIRRDVHKNNRGHCAVFSGGVGTTGAAYLCATAAARTRTGLVTVFADETVYPLLVPKFNSVMIRPLGWIRERLPELKARYSGLLIGPGWGTEDEKQEILGDLIDSGIPGVIDADGITLLAEIMKKRQIQFRANMVLTPHPGECVRLCGGKVEELLTDPLQKLIPLSRQLNTPVIMKGHVSYLVTPDSDYYILDGMNPALATGGSGDVLAGIIAGFISSGVEIITACRLGLLLHARLGEYIAGKNGWFLAEDLLPYISSAVNADEENAIWQ